MKQFVGVVEAGSTIGGVALGVPLGQFPFLPPPLVVVCILPLPLSRLGGYLLSLAYFWLVVDLLRRTTSSSSPVSLLLFNVLSCCLLLFFFLHH